MRFLSCFKMSCMLCFYFFCNFTFFRVGGPISIFNVIDIKEGNDGYHKERFAYMVQYNDVEFDVRCSYYLFELVYCPYSGLKIMTIIL